MPQLIQLVVTRPEPHARTTCNQLRDHGYHPITCPLTKLIPLPLPTLDTSTVQGWVFVSRTAANLWCAHHPPPKNAWVACVGPSTAQCLQEHRWPVHHQPTDGVGAQALLTTLPKPSTNPSIRIICGNEHNPWLDQALAQQGWLVQPTPIYRLEPHPDYPNRVAQALEANPQAVLFHNRRSESLWDQALFHAKIQPKRIRAYLHHPRDLIALIEQSLGANE